MVSGFRSELVLIPERYQSEPLDTVNAVRLRPAMYVGDTTVRGIHQMVGEVLDECLGEVVSGFGTEIFVTLHCDGSVEIADNGRPFPTVPLEAFGGRSNFEVAFQESVIGAQHRGPRAWRVGCEAWFGQGILVAVSALSEWLHAESSDGQTTTRTEYSRGVCKVPMERFRTDRTGLRVRFLPDRDIFKVPDFSADRIRSRMTDVAGMWPGIKLTFQDHRTDEKVGW